MSYRVYLEGEILRIDFFDIVTKSELVAAWRETEAIETGLAVTPHRLTNLSTRDGSENRFPEIHEIAVGRRQKQFPNAFKSALVAHNPVDYGTARMFQTMNDNPQITIRIFPDVAAAKAWLAEP